MKSYYVIAFLLFGLKIHSAALAQGVQPYSFRENNGQIKDQAGNARTDIDFSFQAPGMSLMVGNGQMHYQFARLEGNTNFDSLKRLRTRIISKKEKVPRGSDGKLLYRTPNTIFYRMDVELVGADKKAQVVREEEREETYRYYTQNTKTQQIQTVRTYGKIIYKNIYPHIDWVLYTGGNEFKYDFIVHPGGKISDIKLQYHGADSLNIQANGDLHIATPAALIREHAPVAYVQGTHDTVPAAFSLNKNLAGFNVSPVKGTLVIDPGVDWATYTGGAGGGDITSIATDHKGNVYLLGGTGVDANIITSGAHQTSITSNTVSAAYLAKMNSAGNLIWGTYISGVGDGIWAIGPYTQGVDVACDKYGHVYVTASTWCDSGLATPGSFQSSFSLNAGGFFAPVLMQFNENGQLNWGTYYGASTTTVAFNALACDRQGNVFAAGYADSTTSTTNELISSGAWQTTFGGGVPVAGYCNDGLLVKFDSSGNRLWATYFGGAYDESINAITCDSTGAIYLTGATSSGNGIGTPGSFQPVADPNFVYPGQAQQFGGFVAKFTAAGQRVWGTYLNAIGRGICVNPYGQLYVSGTSNTTHDTMIAGTDAYMNIGLSQRNDFLIRYDAATGQRVWGTYYGGEFQAGSNKGYVTCDSAGNVFLSGPTNSRGAPGSDYVMATPGSHQDTLNAPAGMWYPNSDLYIAMFDSTGGRKWGTYYGGSASEGGGRAVVDFSNSAIYLSGGTSSASAIATPGSFQSAQDTTNGPGSGQGFLVKFMPKDISLDSLANYLPDTLCSGNIQLQVHVTNKGKMAKTSPTSITYVCIGPVNGSGTQTFANPLPIGATQVLSLGTLNMSLPGQYDLTVFLHYTSDDNDFDNDTLHFGKFIVTPPSAAITQYFTANTYHFNSYDNQPGNSYHWDFGDGSSSDQPSEVHIYPDIDSTYLVVLAVTNACGSATDSVRIQTDGYATSVDEAAASCYVNIYPNPATAYLLITATSGTNLEHYTLTDAGGRPILDGRLSQNKGNLSLKNIPAGVYLLRISSDKGMLRKKVVVIK